MDCGRQTGEVKAKTGEKQAKHTGNHTAKQTGEKKATQAKANEAKANASRLTSQPIQKRIGITAFNAPCKPCRMADEPYDYRSDSTQAQAY